MQQYTFTAKELEQFILKYAGYIDDNTVERDGERFYRGETAMDFISANTPPPSSHQGEVVKDSGIWNEAIEAGRKYQSQVGRLGGDKETCITVYADGYIDGQLNRSQEHTMHDTLNGWLPIGKSDPSKTGIYKVRVGRIEGTCAFNSEVEEWNEDAWDEWYNEDQKSPAPPTPVEVDFEKAMTEKLDTIEENGIGLDSRWYNFEAGARWAWNFYRAYEYGLNSVISHLEEQVKELQGRPVWVRADRLNPKPGGLQFFKFDNKLDFKSAGRGFFNDNSFDGDVDGFPENEYPFLWILSDSPAPEQVDVDPRAFAEWVDIEAVRNGAHKWTIGAGDHTKHYTTAELLQLYKQQNKQA